MNGVGREFPYFPGGVGVTHRAYAYDGLAVLQHQSFDNE
jgi:hypothetical protein